MLRLFQHGSFFLEGSMLVSEHGGKLNVVQVFDWDQKIFKTLFFYSQMFPSKDSITFVRSLMLYLSISSKNKSLSIANVSIPLSSCEHLESDLLTQWKRRNLSDAWKKKNTWANGGLGKESQISSLTRFSHLSRCFFLCTAQVSPSLLLQ